jgi:hypothetical protein
MKSMKSNPKDDGFQSSRLSKRSNEYGQFPESVNSGMPIQVDDSPNIHRVGGESSNSLVKLQDFPN